MSAAAPAPAGLSDAGLAEPATVNGRADAEPDCSPNGDSSQVRVGGRVRSWPVGLGEALWLFVTLRLVFAAFSLMVSFQTTLPGSCHYEEAWDHWRTMPQLHRTGLDFRLLGVWQRWDACWYTKIATFGYEPGENSTAFFPLYPAAMRAVGTLLGGNILLGGLVVSALAYIAVVVGLYHLVQFDFEERTAQRTVLYLSVFPSAFFLFAPFTEGLFLALAIWALYAARRRAWAYAAVAALLTGLTRTQGCLLAVPLAWEAVCDWRDRTPQPGDIRWRFWAGFVTPALAAVAPLCGLLLFVGYSDAIVGTTPFQAQHIWGTGFHTPWKVVAVTWQWIRARDDAMQALNLVVLLLFAGLFAVGLRRLPLAYSLYTAPQLLLLVTRLNPTPLTSTSRLVLVLFPTFVLLGVLGRHRRLHYSWLIGSLLFLGLLLYTFLKGDFVA